MDIISASFVIVILRTQTAQLVMIYKRTFQYPLQAVKITG